MSLIAQLNPDALLAIGFEEAYIGFTDNNHSPNVAIYDTEKCIKILMKRDGMNYRDAVEYFDYNVLGAYVGENGPVFATLFADSLLE